MPIQLTTYKVTVSYQYVYFMLMEDTRDEVILWLLYVYLLLIGHFIMFCC